MVEKRLHSNSWTLSGTISIAFSCIGGRSSRTLQPGAHVGVGCAGASAELLAACAITSVAQHAQAASISDWVDSIRSGQVQGLYIGSYYDATPMLLGFGALQEQVMPHARFLQLDAETGRWRAVTFDKYRSLSKRSAPRFGVCEILAQSMVVAYRIGHIWHYRHIHVPPRIIQNQNASCI